MRCIFQCEEGSQRVGFEAALEVGRCGGVDACRAEDVGRASPDIEAAECVQGFVDEGEGVMLGGDRIGVRDDAAGGVLRGEIRQRCRERWIGVDGGCCGAGVDGGCAVGCGVCQSVEVVERDFGNLPASSVTTAAPTG